MAIIGLLEIHHDDIELLDHLDIEAHQTSSWGRTKTSYKAFVDIIIQTLRLEESFENQTYIINERVNDNRKQINSIQEYFSEFLNRSLDSLGISSTPIEDLPSVISINLMPFIFRPADGDRIIQGLANTLRIADNIANTCLVFFVRQHTIISESPELATLVKNDFGPNKVVIIDVDGYSVSVEKLTTGDIKLFKENVSRSIFERILHFKDESAFRKALIYETNINIGHFAANTCHVRTHYDLNDFIRRDNVFEHLYHCFDRIISKYRNISIIAAGLEDDALSILGHRLQSANKNDVNPGSTQGSDNRAILYRGHFTPEKIEDQSDQIAKFCSSSDCIIILTDVVNSGNTVRKIIKDIRRIVNNHVNSAKSEAGSFNFSIIPFAVVKMNNSPQRIQATVTVNRPYFRADRCPLCELGQPLKIINPSTWQEDFRYVDHAQLTPLDFWEMIKDCDALERDKPHMKFSNMFHRVDTARLVERYKNRLSNVIKYKCERAWGNVKPDVIMTIDEKPSSNFAFIVSAVLGLSRDSVLHVPRAVIEGKQKLTAIMQLYFQKREEQMAKILLVDDGINTGHTFRSLIKLVQTHKIIIMGGIVIDNRLKMEKLYEIEAEMNGAKLCSLYTWPSSPHEF